MRSDNAFMARMLSCRHDKSNMKSHFPEVGNLNGSNAEVF